VALSGVNRVNAELNEGPLSANSGRSQTTATDPKQPVDPKNKCVLFSNFD
jgi:hypothetical protein